MALVEGIALAWPALNSGALVEGMPCSVALWKMHIMQGIPCRALDRSDMLTEIVSTCLTSFKFRYASTTKLPTGSAQDKGACKGGRLFLEKRKHGGLNEPHIHESTLFLND
eukprot:822964-Pelagomonas_calceolata.AAC.12